MSHLYEGVYIVDKKRKIVFWNSGSEQITGYLAKEVVDAHCYDNILQHIDGSGKRLCLEGCPLHDTLATGKVNENEVFLHHKNGHRVPVSVKTMPLYDDAGSIVAAVEVFTDSRFKQDQYDENKQLKRLLELDGLTKIYNRNYLEFNLVSSQAEYKQFNMTFGLLFIDIDHFKNINDTYGHNIGDEVLKMVVNTVSANIRSEDVFGRWGGEEFIIVLKRVDLEILKHIAEKLLITVRNSAYKTEDSKEIRVTVSIGGSIYQLSEPIEALVERADALMYESKQAGRDKFTIR